MTSGIRATRLVRVACLAVAAGLAVAESMALTGCARTVSLDAAPDASNPACAAVTVRLPDSVDALPRQATNAQSTAAWGDPSVVLLRCGVTPPGPTTLRCVSISDVDWVIDESNAEFVTATTYGRDPASEAAIARSHSGASVVLADLASAMKNVQAERRCS